MQAIGYVRVSTDAQAADGVSLAAQRARIRAWAASRGCKLVAIHADEGISGKRADNRPGLQAALEDACRAKGVLVAYDLTRLGRELLRRPELAVIVASESYQPAWDGPQLWNGNALLARYPEAVGVKIGYTERAGQTIVAAAERDGRRLIVAVLAAWDRYADAVALLEWAFAETAPAC